MELLSSLGTPFGRVAFPGKGLRLGGVFSGKLSKLIELFPCFARRYSTTR